ncbi:MAG: signal peptide peptidase SppA [Hymenobacteraceae bacterium]|nr:signal peptide peptidase SppA [Hymenobacteraceae bacterium]
MLQFLKYVLATLVGLFLFAFVGVLILIGVAASASSSDSADIAENAVLHLKLDKAINERASENPLAGVPFGGSGVPDALGLDELKATIRHAKSDDDVKGIYLDAERVQAGVATVEELRGALLDFKKSGKWIVTYGEVFSEKSFYLGSVATKSWLNPQGEIEFNGLSSEITFFKHALDRLGIKPYIFRVGTYKSAVEPFFLDKMSVANREQTRAFLSSINDAMLGQIAAARKQPIEQLRLVQDSMLVHNATDAVRYGLVDKAGYYDEVLTWMKQKTGKKPTEKLNLVSLDTYQNVVDADFEAGPSGKRVAVVYAEGDIVTGRGSATSIGSDKFAAALRDARLDEKVKAVVLRINSPGGSALASDVMWREVELLHKAGKPVIASMGDVAASGGYYLAMGCDSIIAQRTTITGSIGVFGLLANLAPFLDDKIGITTDRVGTGHFSDLPTVTRDLTAYEQRQIQREVDRIYADFTAKAARGRHLPVEELRAVASGRVWSGAEARTKGLVDSFGGLEDAIAVAAKRAKLETGDYSLRKLPATRTYFEELLRSFGGEAARAQAVRAELGVLAPYYAQLQRLAALQNGVQARLPFELEIQ